MKYQVNPQFKAKMQHDARLRACSAMIGDYFRSQPGYVPGTPINNWLTPYRVEADFVGKYIYEINTNASIRGNYVGNLYGVSFYRIVKQGQVRLLIPLTDKNDTANNIHDARKIVSKVITELFMEAK